MAEEILDTVRDVVEGEIVRHLSLLLHHELFMLGTAMSQS
jgi:hypothetical protein